MITVNGRSSRLVGRVTTEADVYAKTPGFTGPHPVSEKLIACLDILKQRFGPLTITSTYRTPAANAAAGGARNSQHVQGRAADLRPVSQENFRKLVNDLKHEGPVFLALKAAGMRGVGIYTNWVHIDTRQTEVVAKWDKSGATWTQLFKTWVDPKGDDDDAGNEAMERGKGVLPFVLLALGALYLIK